MQTVISMRGIEKVYPMGETEVRALDGANLEVKAGEFVAIVGRSGSGKSTLMNIIGCLDLPTAGIYTLDGEAVSAMSASKLAAVRGRTIGFVFQQFHLLPTLSAVENVELPLSYSGMPKAARRARAEEVLRRVGMGERLYNLPGQMSGGQQQRVAIARAVAGRPAVLLADEPTGNLDEENGQAVMTLLHDLHREGTTVVLITHDSTVAAQAERVLEMRAGRLFDAEKTWKKCAKKG